MRRFLFLPLSVLLACAEEPADDKDDTTGNVDSDTVDSDGTDTDGADTDAVDTDAVDTTDTTETVDTTDTTPLVDTGGDIDLYHVIETVRALPQAQGFDLDGDGTVDNSLGRISQSINSLGLSSYGTTNVLAGTEVLGGGPAGGVVTLGILTLQDTDGLIADNFTGTEDFLLFGGVPVSTATAQLAADGTYSAVLPAGTLTFGALALATSTELHVEGTVGPLSHSGRIGTAILQSTLQALLDSLGAGALGALLNGLADLDTDGDGTADSISMTLSFDGPACVLQP